MQTAGHADAQSFIATARSLIEGRPLRKIPVMVEVHDLTIGSWLHHKDEDADGPDFDDALLDDPGDLPPMPTPEKTGERAKLLKGTTLSPDWIDGHLTAICIAPRPESPDRWVQPLLSAALPAISGRSLQRFLDLIMVRYITAVDRLSDPERCEAALTALPPARLGGWSAGFLAGKQGFKSSWPAKALGATGKVILRQIMQLAEDPASEALSCPDLAAWLARRFDPLPG